MPSSVPARVAAMLSVAALVLLGLSAPGVSQAAARPTLSVSPQQYVGGQLVTYRGNVGAPGVRVRLQGSQRAGAPWETIARRTSDSDGSYQFSMPAPSMFRILRRVVAQGVASEPIEMYAKSQDLVVVPEGRPVAGQPFELVVSTVPGPHWGNGHPFYLRGRPDDLPPPVLPDRTLTLQRQQGRSWVNVPGATTQTDDRGEGRFTITVDDPGQVVFRVRQEDDTTTVRDRSGALLGRNAIGWFPSFPTSVRIAATAATARSYEVPAGPSTTTTAARRVAVESSARAAEPRNGFSATTAAATFGWGPVLWNFGFPEGQSLTSPPVGTVPRGRLLDGTTGSGRAAQHNGGLLLDSQRYTGATGDRGDHGTTWVTMQGNARRYGRWEARIRLRPYENAARDYRGRVELVPARAPEHGSCGPVIVVADLAAHSRKMRLGATVPKARRTWAKTRRVGDIKNHPLAVAVEVTKRHVTWFLDGRPIGTVRSRAASPDVPLTMRLTLQGRRSEEMNRTKAHFDWMRGYSLQRGRSPAKGGALSSKRFRGC